MQIFVNGNAREVDPQCDLAALIAQLGLGASSCATAVNGQFVARGQRAGTQLASGDQIMTFEPITGG